jgi:hypothetical protein
MYGCLRQRIGTKSLIKVFGSAAKNLCHHRAFRWCIEKVAEDAVTTAPQALDIGKFSENHVRAAIDAIAAILAI